MSSFSQLCRDTITKTGRPDLIDETQLAVRDATSFVHMSNLWLRDCDERLFPFAIVSYRFQINLALMERYRKLRFLKKFDLGTQLPKEGEENEMKEGSPSSLFDRYGSVRKNIYYLAGNNINVLCDTQEQGIYVSWYKYPDTNPESFSSWIAEIYPVIITNKAKAFIQRDIGMVDEANAMDKWVLAEDLPIVAMNDIQATA